MWKTLGHYLWRYCSYLISLPVLIGAICFAVGNREPTIITLWPFGYVMPLPIYLLALAPLAFGLLCGAIMQWFISLRYRVAVQRLGRDLAKLREENQSLKEQMKDSGAAAPDSASRSRLKLIGAHKV